MAFKAARERAAQRKELRESILTRMKTPTTPLGPLPALMRPGDDGAASDSAESGGPADGEPL